jgi:large subunit ribosomal protein L7/L12
MSPKNVIATNSKNKNRMIVALVKQVAALEEEVGSLASQIAETRASITSGTNEERTRHLSTLIRALAVGNKIEAIKAVRNLTGLGLKESKDLMDGAERVQLKVV